MSAEEPVRFRRQLCRSWCEYYWSRLKMRRWTKCMSVKWRRGKRRKRYKNDTWYHWWSPWTYCSHWSEASWQCNVTWHLAPVTVTDVSVFLSTMSLHDARIDSAADSSRSIRPNNRSRSVFSNAEFARRLDNAPVENASSIWQRRTIQECNLWRHAYSIHRSCIFRSCVFGISAVRDSSEHWVMIRRRVCVERQRRGFSPLVSLWASELKRSWNLYLRLYVFVQRKNII